MSINFILYFFIYGVIGWITEVIFCLIVDKEVVNRGFLKGPICPIYGVGAIFVLLLLEQFKGRIGVIFILGILIATVIEYLTSCVLESIFQTKWWDYSNNKFNINGRVCLFNSLLFGVLAVFLVEIIHPFLCKIVDTAPRELIIIITIILLMVLVIDLVKSIKALLSINSNVYKLENFIQELKKYNLDLYSILQDDGKKIGNQDNRNLKAKLKEKLNQKINLTSREKSLFKAFPKGTHKKYNESFKKLKKIINTKK